MFANLFASLMLATACGTPTLNFHPKKANQNSYLYGGYVLRDNTENYNNAMNYLADEGGQQYHTANAGCYVMNYKYANNFSMFNGYIWFEESRDYPSQEPNGFTFHLMGDGSEPDFYWDVEKGDVYEDVPQGLQEIEIFFTDYTYVDIKFANVFNMVFTKEGNRNYTAYTGWYTFSETQPTIANVGVMGNITANNNLFNLMDLDTRTAEAGGILFRYVTPIQNNNTYYWLYHHNPAEWDGIRNIYLTNVLISDTAYQNMEQRGIFDYIPPQNTSDFQDLFFTIADTPIKYLTTWLNIEILGFNLGVALTSLLTLLLIVFVIKKLV